MPIHLRTTLLCALAATSLAAAAPAIAAPATWVVDRAASSLGFKSSFSGMAFDGSFRRWNAEIAFDPKDLADSKAVVTVETGTATAGDDSRDEAMPTGDWFDVAHFPKATFATRSIKSLGGDRYDATADLTIRGVTKSIDLPFTLVITGDQAKMTGEVVLDRSAFGVGQGEYASADTVPLNVTVVVSLTANRAP